MKYHVELFGPDGETSGVIKKSYNTLQEAIDDIAIDLDRFGWVDAKFYAGKWVEAKFYAGKRPVYRLNYFEHIQHLDSLERSSPVGEEIEEKSLQQLIDETEDAIDAMALPNMNGRAYPSSVFKKAMMNQKPVCQHGIDLSRARCSACDLNAKEAEDKKGNLVDHAEMKLLSSENMQIMAGTPVGITHDGRLKKTRTGPKTGEAISVDSEAKFDMSDEMFDCLGFKEKDEEDIRREAEDALDQIKLPKGE